MLVGFSLLLTACNITSATREPQFVDRSFISDEPCASPCWYGLLLGKSTGSEVEAKLAELPFVDQEAIRKSMMLVFSLSRMGHQSNSVAPNRKGKVVVSLSCRMI
jgi:hypothetical protein